MFNIWEKNMCTLGRPRQSPVNRAAPMSASTMSASMLLDMVQITNAVSVAISLLRHSDAHFLAAKASETTSLSIPRLRAVRASLVRDNAVLHTARVPFMSVTMGQEDFADHSKLVQCPPKAQNVDNRRVHWAIMRSSSKYAPMVEMHRRKND